MNKVCFCFPFPFFFPPPLAPAPASGPSPPTCSPEAGVFDPLPPLSPHAGCAGALVPKIFRNDWFPLTAAFGTRVVLFVGSSGNADFESTAGPPFDLAPGPGTDVGARTTGAGDDDAAVPAPEDAHGVVRWGWRKLDELLGPPDPWRGGNAFAPGVPARGAGAELDDAAGAGLDAAARATRSHSWREDWADERVAVECFALRTRPLVTPAHSEPVAVGTSSGNWLRCWGGRQEAGKCWRKGREGRECGEGREGGEQKVPFIFTR